MRTYKKSLMIVVCLIIAASAALAYVGKREDQKRPNVKLTQGGDGPLSIKSELVQDKVLKGSEGNVSVALTLKAAELLNPNTRDLQNTDLVVVLDRSGSMNGQKINDACRSVAYLIDCLTPQDRLALITYSNKVKEISPLIQMNDLNRKRLKRLVREVSVGGGTNLGGGLQQGINVLARTTSNGNQRKMILISDGLANQGITEPSTLYHMAGKASGNSFSISTVGVGYDFNEILMTGIADHGTGQYYFLENPNAFAQVFEQELKRVRDVTASNLEIRVLLEKGVHLVHAGGYPINIEDGYAVIYPGDLLSGQQRNLFLTFQVPTDKAQDLTIASFEARYHHAGDKYQIDGGKKITLTCVQDKKAVMSSIDQTNWGEKVIQEDFTILKEAVADAIRKGEKEDAVRTINEYEKHKRGINSTVGSKIVTENLEGDVQDLRQSVEETFSGSPSVIEEKKKQKAKALQYESYRVRRDKR